jgi:hypothetical protein
MSLTPEQMQEDGRTACYAGFWTKLDCNICGGEIEVEGDVHNDQIIECLYCHTELVVENR